MEALNTTRGWERWLLNMKVLNMINWKHWQRMESLMERLWRGIEHSCDVTSYYTLLESTRWYKMVHIIGLADTISKYLLCFFFFYCQEFIHVLVGTKLSVSASSNKQLWSIKKKAFACKTLKSTIFMLLLICFDFSVIKSYNWSMCPN